MVLENLKKFIDYKGISIAAFEKSIGMSNNSFRKSLNTGGNLGSDKLENILKVYPELNPIWILTGNGEMLINNNWKDKNAYVNAYPNAYLSPQLDYIHSQSSIVAEPSLEDMSKKSPLAQQYGGANDIIMDLVDRLNEQSEEIGALRQENSYLKNRLAQLAEDVGDVDSVPA